MLIVKIAVVCGQESSTHMNNTSKYVENLKCSVQIKVAERYWLGRGWQRTFRIVQSRKFLARNAEGRCIGNALKSMLLLFV